MTTMLIGVCFLLWVRMQFNAMERVAQHEQEHEAERLTQASEGKLQQTEMLKLVNSRQTNSIKPSSQHASTNASIIDPSPHY